MNFFFDEERTYINNDYFIVPSVKISNGDELTIKGNLDKTIKWCNSKIHSVDGNQKYHDKYGVQFTMTKYLGQKSPINDKDIKLWLIHKCNFDTELVNHIVTYCNNVSKAPNALKNVLYSKKWTKHVEKMIKNSFHMKYFIDTWKYNVLDRTCALKLKKCGIKSSVLRYRLAVQYRDVDIVSMVKTNPFILTKPPLNCSFIKIDDIRKNIGSMPLDDPLRLSAIVYDILMNNPNICYQYHFEIRKILAKYGIKNKDRVELPKSDNYILSKYLRNKGKYIYVLRDNLEKESIVASFIQRKLWRDDPISCDTVSLSDNKVLNDIQKKGILNAFNKDISIITGGPGTGKSRIISEIINYIDPKYIILCAPTGKACMQLKKYCEVDIDVFTLHKLIVPKYNGEPVFAPEIIIIDEISMVNVNIFCKLLVCTQYDFTNTRFVFVGDNDQLPCIGMGSLFKELLSIMDPSYPESISKLNICYRQAKDSQISLLARDICLDETKDISFYNKNDISFIKCDSYNEIMETIHTIHKNHTDIGGFIGEKMQVIVPMHGGAVGRKSLCDKIGSLCNKREPNQKYSTRDKIMWLKNDGEMVNGMIGYIDSINSSIDKLVISYDGGLRTRECKINEKSLQLAYAMTIHKTQGSEYDVVCIVLHKDHKNMINKRLLYTAITRAKVKLYICGDVYLFNECITNNNIKKTERSLISMIVDGHVSL